MSRETKRDRVRGAVLQAMKPTAARDGWQSAAEIREQLVIDATHREVLHALRAVAKDGRCLVRRSGNAYSFLRLTPAQEELRSRQERRASLAQKLAEDLASDGWEVRWHSRTPAFVLVEANSLAQMLSRRGRDV